ncbi:MAG: hypothetical protein N2491_06215 [Negativicutes bacterium]|nr:hypothetical protein [Negativicutes bacterium]
MAGIKRANSSASPRYAAMIKFIDNVFDANHLAERVKEFETDGWQACLEEPFQPFRMKTAGRYQVTFLRKRY